RDRAQAPQALDGDQHRLTPRVLACRVHAGVVEVDQLGVGRSASVLSLEQLARLSHELGPAVVRTVSRHSGGAVQKALPAIFPDPIARLRLQDRRQVPGVVEYPAGARSGLLSPTAIHHFHQRIPEIREHDVLVAIVEVRDVLSSFQNAGDLPLVPEQEFVQQTALLCAGPSVEDLAHLGLPRGLERVPVALAAPVVIGPAAEPCGGLEDKGCHRGSFGSSGAAVKGNPGHTVRSWVCWIRPWEMKASNTASSRLPWACSSKM